MTAGFERKASHLTSVCCSVDAGGLQDRDEARRVHVAGEEEGEALHGPPQRAADLQDLPEAAAALSQVHPSVIFYRVLKAWMWVRPRPAGRSVTLQPVVSPQPHGEEADGDPERGQADAEPPQGGRR